VIACLGMVLPAAAAKYGDKTALIVPERAFSFRELDALANAVAASLVKLGVAPGDRVTLYAPSSWEWLVSYYGSLKTGAVINPINGTSGGSTQHETRHRQGRVPGGGVAGRSGAPRARKIACLTSLGDAQILVGT
jgi:acyl-CoA synthetase (AMP-forming)/AMP-acid ligase II